MAVPALTELLTDKDAGIRLAAIQTLREIGPEAKMAVPALTSLLKNRDVQCEAASALGRIGPDAKTAVPALIELLTEAEDRRDAAEALGRIGPDAKAAVPALTKTLTDQDTSVREAAAWALGKMGRGAETSVPVLAELLKDKDVRWDAALALGRIGPAASAAVPALTELLNDKDHWPEPASALARIGPAAKAAVPTLTELLKDKDRQWSAASALAGIGPEAKSAIPVLAGLLREKDEDDGSRQHFASVLVKIGPTSIPAFMELLNDQDEQMRSLAIWGLGEIGPEANTAVPALTALLKEKNESVRQAAARALGEIGPQAQMAVPALTELLQDKDVLLRWVAAKALGEIDLEAKSSAPALTKLLKDKNREVRDAAASALGRSAPAAKETEVNVKAIKSLIAGLAMIDTPDVGFSPTMAGSAFAPIASSEQFEAFLITEHGLKHNAAFTSLVELGPTALPFLLESLDDKTPTNLIVGDPLMGGMWLSHEICGNPLNAHEARVLADVIAADEESFWDRRELGAYTVKVGDICFVAIGQITNRPYTAVRYQPSGCVVVNSPVEDHKLAAEVRAIWGKSDYRQKLLDSLLIDFRTQERWRNGFQCDAAMRLAYYFPDATEDLIIARLNELEAAPASSSQQTADAAVKDMVTAVAWSNSPGLRAALLDIFRRTTDPETLVAAMPLEKQHDELVFRRITERLDALPKDDPRPFGDGYALLVALGNRLPDRAQNVFQNYLAPGTVGRCRTVIYALQQTCGDLAIPLLKPLLEDKRSCGQTYSVNPNGNGPHYPLRVCDEAAETIAMHSKTLKFDMKGTPENSDRQIEVMRRRIAEMKPSK